MLVQIDQKLSIQWQFKAKYSLLKMYFPKHKHLSFFVGNGHQLERQPITQDSQDGDVVNRTEPSDYNW